MQFSYSIIQNTYQRFIDLLISTSDNAQKNIEDQMICIDDIEDTVPKIYKNVEFKDSDLIKIILPICANLNKQSHTFLDIIEDSKKNKGDKTFQKSQYKNKQFHHYKKERKRLKKKNIGKHRRGGWAFRANNRM